MLTNIIEKYEVSPRDRKKYIIFKKKPKSTPIDISNKCILTTAVTDKSHYEKLDEMISQSKVRIKLSTFLFDDIDAAKLLIEAAKRLKGGVYILTSIITDKIRRDYGYSKGDMNRHLEVLKVLDTSPVSVRCVDGLHAKFWIFDDEKAVVTSSNLTINSLNRVPELGLLLTKIETVKQLVYEFNNLWLNFSMQEMQDGSLSQIGKRSFVELNKPNNDNFLVFFTNISSQHKNWKDVTWFEKFHSIINKTTKELLISSYSLDFSSKEISDIIIDRLENNVIIKVLIAERPFKRNTDFMDWCLEQTKKFGDRFEFIIHQNNHTKFIISDQSKSLISTKNYEPIDKHPSSYEIGVVSDSITNELLSIWNKLVIEAHSIDYVDNQEEYYRELSNVMNVSIRHESNFQIKIWHPQAPVYGYFYGLTVKEIAKFLHKAKYLTLFLNREKKIIQINQNLKLHINNRQELYRVDETGEKVDGMEKWLLKADKITFYREKFE